MSVHDPRATLRQIQDAACRLQMICADKTMEKLLADWQATASLERFIEILGEGVKRLPMDLRSRYSSVPWKEIAGTRDHLSQDMMTWIIRCCGTRCRRMSPRSSSWSCKC